MNFTHLKSHNFDADLRAAKAELTSKDDAEMYQNLLDFVGEEDSKYQNIDPHEKRQYLKDKIKELNRY